MHDLNTKAKEAHTKAEDAWNNAAQYQNVVEKLKAARNQQEWHQRILNDLRQDLKERDESDEWLQTELDRFEERMGIHEDHKKQQTRRYEELKREIENVRERQRVKHSEAGKYEEQKAHHEQQITRRESLIKETARRHNIRGYETDLDDMQINEYMERITRLCKDQNASVERVRRETDREVQKAQDVLSKLGERRSALNENKNSFKQQTASNDRKIGACQSDLGNIEIDDGGKALLESNIGDLDSRLRKTKDDLRANSLDNKIQEGNIQLRGLEDESEQLNRELIQGTKQAGDLARLDHLKKELKDRQRSLDTLIGAHGDRLFKIIGPNWQASSLDNDFQIVVDKRKTLVKEAECQRDGITRGLEQIEFKLNSTRADLKNGQQELEACEKRIKRTTQEGDPEDYPEYLALVQTDRDIRQKDVEAFNIMRSWYTDCINSAKTDKPLCRLCDRVFVADKERLQFIRKLDMRMSTAALDGLNKELRDLDADLDAVKGAGSSYDTWKRLFERELPKLQDELKRSEDQREAHLRQIEDHDKTVNDRDEERRDAETLTRPVANIVKYSLEITSFEDQIRELAVKQKDAGLSRTLEDVQEQLESNGAKSRALRSNIAKITADKERFRGQISTLELDLSRAKNNLTSANYQIEKRANISRQIEDLKKLNGEHRSSIARIENEIHELGPQISEEEAKLDDIKQRGSGKEKELQQEASKLSDSVHQLKRADQDIRAYIEAGGASKLDRCQREIQNAEQDIIRLEAEQKQITIEVNKIAEELRNHQQTKRSIVDNIKYRRSLRELEAVKAEIGRLSAQNAEADLEHHNKRAEHWQRQHMIFETEKTSKMGTMKAKDDQLTQLINDWETDYKDAAFNFKKAHIEVEVRLGHVYLMCHIA